MQRATVDRPRIALKRAEVEPTSQEETVATLKEKLTAMSLEQQGLREELSVTQEQLERVLDRSNTLSKSVPSLSKRPSLSELREANQDAEKARAARLIARGHRALTKDGGVDF